MDIYKQCIEITNQASCIDQQEAETALCPSDEMLTPVRATMRLPLLVICRIRRIRQKQIVLQTA